MRGKSTLSWGEESSPSLAQSQHSLGQVPPCLWASLSCSMQMRWPGSVFSSVLLGALGRVKPPRKSGRPESWAEDAIFQDLFPSSARVSLSLVCFVCTVTFKNQMVSWV